MDVYKIDLLGRDLREKSWEWDIDDDFFAAIDGLVRRGTLKTTVECVATGITYRFSIHSVGAVIVPCDRCLADVELRIDTQDELAVKLGDEYDDNGDCVTIPEADGYIDLAQFIYEFIVLSMPITCQHEPGECDDTMMQALSEHQTARSGQEGDEDEDNNDGDADDAQPVDARWAALAKLR